MQIKRTLRFHLTPVRMAKIKNSGDRRCWQGCGERGTLLHWGPYAQFDGEHPRLYWSGSGRTSQETAISGSCQQAILGISNSVWVWCLMWDGSPGVAVPGWPLLQPRLLVSAFPLDRSNSGLKFWRWVSDPLYISSISSHTWFCPSFPPPPSLFLPSSCHPPFPLIILFPLLSRTEASTLWSSFLLSFMWSVNCILGFNKIKLEDNHWLLCPIN